MKKIIYIFVAFIAFALGIIGFYLFHTTKSDLSYKVVESKVVQAEVVESEVLESVEEDKGQIKIRGYLEVRRLDSIEVYDVMYFKRNDSGDFVEEASLRLPENIENQKKIINLIKELGEKNERTNRNGIFIAGVQVTGTLIKANCSHVPPTTIKVEKIEQISPIKFLSQSKLAEIIDRKEPFLINFVTNL